jgi:cytochrome c-type biogenesis protein
MFDIDLARPLTLGLVAAFNPCGFAMLPAYVSYFLGLESDDETNVARNVMRALVVAVTMTLGFMAVFGTIGILTSTLIAESTLSRNVPYATVAFGIGMIPLGIAMLRGYEPKLNIRRLQAGGGSNQLPSIFLFGVSYAIVSVSCTIGLFLAAVADSFTREGEGVLNGMAGFLAYAAGMGLVILVLSIGVALARNSVATNMRRFLPYVNKVSGGMLILAGAYLATFGWWEIQVLRGNNPDNPVVELGERVQSTIQNWINDVGATRLAMGVAVIVGFAIVWAITAQMANRNDKRMIRGGFLAVYALLEVVTYRFDLLVLPLLRTIADIPERIGNWFTDPFRWPVMFELMLAAIIAVVLWFAVGRRLLARGDDDRERDATTDTAAAL